jgi:hypothetical protein
MSPTFSNIDNINNQQIQSICIRRIHITFPDEIDTGVVKRRSTTLNISADIIINGKVYTIPESGGRISLKLNKNDARNLIYEPLTMSELSDIKVILNVYGKKFSVNMPSDCTLHDGNLDLVFVQYYPKMIFDLHDAKDFIEFLNKKYTRKELKYLKSSCISMIRMKKKLLNGIDSEINDITSYKWNI